MKFNEKLSFNVPIAEFVSQDKSKDFKIFGTAINETTTRNGISYISEELQSSANTLRNKPILKDHENKVDNIVGTTTENVYFDEASKSIKFEGVIKDKKMKEMISEGLIKSVSIGAMVRDIQEVTESDSDDKKLIARGIDFVELSLVAVPADPNAGFAMAMAEKYDKKIKCEVEKMAEEIKQEKTKIQTLQEERAKLEEEIEQLKLEKLQSEKVKLLKEQEEAEAEPEEEAPVEEPKEEPKEEVEDKTEGEVEAEEEETTEEKFKLISENGDYQLVLNNTESLKRMVRY